MINKEFEKIIKEKINQADDDAKASPDWDVFCEILKNAEGFEIIHDQSSDRFLKEKIENHRTSYRVSHWMLLKNRLLKEEFLRKKIFTTKASEAILLLLLFFTFQHYQTSVYSLEYKDQVVREVRPKPDAPAMSEDIVAYAYSTQAYPAQSQKETLVFTNENENENSSEAIELTQTSSHIEEVIRTTENVKPLSSKSPILSLKPFKSDFALEPEAPKIKIAKPVDKTEKYLTPVISAGLGITKSGYDKIYNLKSYSAYSDQYSAGMLYSVKKNKIEFQTGLRYSKRTHKPAAIIETYGSLSTNYYQISLNEISYDIIEIPLSMKYFMKSGKNTSYYAKVGVNSNFALVNKYDIREKPLGYAVPAAPISSFSGKISKPVLEKKEFNKGILQGGKATDNFFFTLSTELGVERKVGNKNAVSFGLEYNKYYMLEGIGPNKEKLNSLGFNIGVKHLIN